MKLKNIRIAIPEDLHRNIKITAATNDMNMPEAIIMILQKYYEKSEGHEKDRT